MSVEAVPPVLTKMGEKLFHGIISFHLHSPDEDFTDEDPEPQKG